ncbi:MAG: hypothetical protein PUK40_02810 [Actinomycetaceae bacterium]|nr:hypothetical protein [Arcanobacterium sp.]MDD7504872.1 hypothetical protein [Actinomycetaceae bacterium]
MTKRGNKTKRVVRLSRVDQERLERGEITYPEEAVHISDAKSVHPKKPEERATSAHSKLSRNRPRGSNSDTDALTPFERDIIANVPPHFGAL